MFSIVEAETAVGRRTTVQPNGDQTKPARRKGAIRNGIAMMSTHSQGRRFVTESEPDARKGETSQIEEQTHGSRLS
jgi:hypothetical protein